MDVAEILRTKPPWFKIALGVGVVGLLGFFAWRSRSTKSLASPSVLQMIAAESRSPEEFARRAEAWASTEARPPGDRALLRAYPGVSLRMIHEARGQRIGTSRGRFQALINQPDDDAYDELEGPPMHMVDGKRWTRKHSPAAAGYKPTACKAGIPDLHCWVSPARLSTP